MNQVLRRLLRKNSMFTCLCHSLPIHVRKATQHDVPFMIDIQEKTYPDHLHESIETFGAIVDENMSFVAIDIDTKRMVGYVLIHRILSIYDPPYLNNANVASNTDTYFIHDLCILPKEQGKGYGGYLWRHAFSYLPITSSTKISCIGLEDSIAFWKHQGFIEMPCKPDITETYSERATYLVLEKFTAFV